jgi:hypothetical protein
LQSWNPSRLLVAAGFFVRHEAEKAAGREFGDDEPFNVSPQQLEEWVPTLTTHQLGVLVDFC